MKKVISKFKELLIVVGMSVVFISLLAGMIATIGFLIFAIKMAWFGVTF